MARKRTEESDAILPDRRVQRHSRLRAHWLMALVNKYAFCVVPGIAAFPSYLSFDYERSLRAELKGGENFLHWKANVLLLFSIITLWDI